MSSSLVRALREDDAEAVAVLFSESFGDSRQVDAAEIRSWLANEELWAEDEARRRGIPRVRTMPPAGHELAGDALLRSSFAALYDRGLRRVGLVVDSQNSTGALGLYERAGMHKVDQTDNWVRDPS